MESEGYVFFKMENNFFVWLIVILIYGFCFYRKFPPIKWAQNAGSVLMTIDLADVEKDSINIDVNEETNGLSFRYVYFWLMRKF